MAAWNGFIKPYPKSPAACNARFRFVSRLKSVPMIQEVEFDDIIAAVLLVPSNMGCDLRTLVICDTGEVFVFESRFFMGSFQTDKDPLVEAFLTKNEDLLCVFEQSIVIYCIETGREKKVEIFDRNIVCAVYSMDGDYVATAFDNGEWVMWHLDGTIEGPFPYQYNQGVFEFWKDNRSFLQVRKQEYASRWTIGHNLVAQSFNQNKTIKFFNGQKLLATADRYSQDMIKFVSCLEDRLVTAGYDSIQMFDISCLNNLYSDRGIQK